KQYYAKLALLVIWLTIQCFLLWQNGIVTTFEAEKYISLARYFLKSGNFSSNKFWLYSTEIFLIAGTIKLHLNLIIVVVIQLLLNLLSTVMFYKLAAFFLKNSTLAFLVTSLFIINIPYQVYNSFLFTESIFYSLTIIYSSYLLRLDKLTITKIIFLLFFLVLISITRPTGVLFFVATVFFVFFRFLNHIFLWKKLVIACGVIIILLIVLNTMLQVGGSLDFMLPFKKENIICEVNTTENAQIETLEKGNSVQGILYYVIHNKKQFFRLSKLKTISFFGLVRSYYSITHNIFLVLFFYPFYLLSFIGLWKMFVRKEQPFYYMLAIILLYWITTLLTCDDWHNRFVLTIIPFIFLIGFSAFTKGSPVKENENQKILHESTG
ncbi:MAG: hypothetical protein ABIO55_10390, partial [Ginsengibacter sp.]